MNELEDSEVCAICHSKPDFLTERSFRVNGISGCGHKFCSSCIDKQFRTKVHFRCPKCQKAVRREQLAYKEIEEVEYERDCEKRIQIKKIFNKIESDFASIEEFLDYEEMVEDIIYTIVKNEDPDKVKEAIAIIEQYKKDNATTIRRNAGRQQDLARQIDDEITIEESLRKERDDEFQRKLLDEMKQQEKIRKIQDAVALGEVDLAGSAITDGSSAAKSKAKEVTVSQEGWNPVIAFLNQRAEPQPVATLTADKKTVTLDRSNERQIHAAGGYNISFREKRGWNEIYRLSGNKRKLID